MLLPHGRASQVTKESDYLDVLLDYVPPSGMGMLLVTLHIVTRGVKSKYEGIEVHLDGVCIGELTKQTSAKFINAVRYYDDLGLTTTAKAWIKGSSLAAEVTIQAAQSHELSEQDLQPKVSPLPRLIQYSDDPLNYPVPDAYSRSEDHDIQHQILDNKGKKYKGLPATSHLYSKFDKYSQDAERDKQLYPPKKNPSASYHLFTKENISKQDLFEAWMNVRDKKRVLLWIGVVFASLSVLSGIGNLTADVPGGLGSIFIGAGAGLLCGRALYCHSQDKKSIAEWKKQQETNAELKQSLMDSDPLIAAGLSSNPPPQPKPRRWKIVGTLAVILVVTGFALLSSSEATTFSTAPRAITGFQQL